MDWLRTSEAFFLDGLVLGHRGQHESDVRSEEVIHHVALGREEKST